MAAIIHTPDEKAISHQQKAGLKPAFKKYEEFLVCGSLVSTSGNIRYSLDQLVCAHFIFVSYDGSLAVFKFHLHILYSFYFGQCRLHRWNTVDRSRHPLDFKEYHLSICR